MQVAETFAFHLSPDMLPLGSAAAKLLANNSTGLVPDETAPSSNGESQRPAAKQQQNGKHDATFEPPQPGKEQNGTEGSTAATEACEDGTCTGVSLSHFARLDTCVTVIDAASFYDNLDSIEELGDRYNMSLTKSVCNMQQ